MFLDDLKEEKSMQLVVYCGKQLYFVEVENRNLIFGNGYPKNYLLGPIQFFLMVFS